MLLQFMKTTAYTTWFLAPTGACSIASDSLQIAADTQTISWRSNVPSGPFDLARGNLRDLHASNGSFSAASCLRNDITTMSAIDLSSPPPSVGAYYIVRCDGGTWNDGTQQGDRDTTLMSCP